MATTMSTGTAVMDKKVAPVSTASAGIVIAAAVAVLLAHLPLIFIHFQQLWLKPHYQLFPIVLAGGFLLVWPLATFKPAVVSGPLKWALWLAGAGLALVAIGFVVDNAPALGSPSTWMATAGLAMLTAIPIALFGGPNKLTSGQGSPAAGRNLVIAGLLVLAVCVFLDSPAFAVVSFLMVTASIPLTLGGGSLFKRHLGAFVFLLLLVPPPLMLDEKLVGGLQVVASKAASKILDQMGVFHNLNGVTIEVGKNTYLVEEACSGISSLLSTLACVLFYVFWFQIHWLRGTVLTLSAVFWVLVNNVARIIAITFFGVGFTVLGRFFSFDLASGFGHFLLGIVLFALTLGLLWSTDRFLMFLGRSDLPRRRHEPLAVTGEAATALSKGAESAPDAWYRSPVIVGLFTVLFLVQGAKVYALLTRVPYSGTALSKHYQQIDVDVLPAKYPEKGETWQRGDKVREETRAAGSPFGQFSRIWEYKRRGDQRVAALLSLDFPYPDYHDLRVCYNNTGWTMNETEKKTIDSEPKLHYVRVKMSRPVQQFQTLWFCEFDQDGVGVDPTALGQLHASSVGQRFMWRIEHETNRWQRLFGAKTDAEAGIGSILQVQLLVPSTSELNPAELKEYEALFLDGAMRLRQKCRDLKNAKP